MNRVILGALGALALVSLGLFWWQGKASVERLAPPALPSAPPPDPMDLPSADDDALANIEGPDLPVASELSREQKRFARYDRDRDGRVSRAELLSARTAAFRKLDKDGNNLLTFEEWAVTTVDKFQGADANHDLYLTPAEFRSTAPPKPKAKPATKLKCSCR